VSTVVVPTWPFVGSLLASSSKPDRTARRKLLSAVVGVLLDGATRTPIAIVERERGGGILRGGVHGWTWCGFGLSSWGQGRITIIHLQSPAPVDAGGSLGCCRSSPVGWVRRLAHEWEHGMFLKFTVGIRWELEEAFRPTLVWTPSFYSRFTVVLRLIWFWCPGTQS
jgi:hypothetical protein